MRKTIGVLAFLFFINGCAYELARPIQSEIIRKEKKTLADDGNAEAEFQMGAALCCGPKGRHYDTEKAMEYFCSAAKKGHVGSQLWLGKIYENSIREGEPVVPKNDLKAYMWYSVASSTGNADASDLLKNISQTMTPNNLARAKQYTAHWRSVRCGPLQESEGPWNPEWVAAQQAQLVAEAKKKKKNFAKPKTGNDNAYPNR